jgi:hypothetical protein
VKDGVPAFPNSDSQTCHKAGLAASDGMEGTQRDAVYLRVSSEYARGMSLRDWFAGRAMSGICERSGFSSAMAQQQEYRTMAEACWRMADAMLAERENGGAES